jgi:hypothetical protein
MVHITVQYFDDCPNWRTGRDRLHAAVQQVGADRFDIELRLILSHEQAVAEGFHGSPSFLLDGVDPFADPGAPVGMACRVYRTTDGLAGSPTVEQLVEVLAGAVAT